LPIYSRSVSQPGPFDKAQGRLRKSIYFKLFSMKLELPGAVIIQGVKYQKGMEKSRGKRISNIESECPMSKCNCTGMTGR